MSYYKRLLLLSFISLVANQGALAQQGTAVDMSLYRSAGQDEDPDAQRGRFNFRATIVRSTCSLSFSRADQTYDLSQRIQSGFSRGGKSLPSNTLIQIDNCDLLASGPTLSLSNTRGAVVAFTSDFYGDLASNAESTSISNNPIQVDDKSMAFLLSIDSSNQLLGSLLGTNTVLRLSYK